MFFKKIVDKGFCMKIKYVLCGLLFIINISAENIQNHFSSFVDLGEVDHILPDDEVAVIDLDELQEKINSFYAEYLALRHLAKTLLQERDQLLKDIGKTVELFSGIDQLSTLQKKIYSVRALINTQRVFKIRIHQFINEINKYLKNDEIFEQIGLKLFELLAEAEGARAMVADEVE
jgi:hypothetical protein